MQAVAFSTKPASSLARPAAAMARNPARRASLVVVAAKGGEEGGATWDKSVYGRLGASGAYNLLASSIKKVRFLRARL
jgi:hypothetical protein